MIGILLVDDVPTALDGLRRLGLFCSITDIRRRSDFRFRHLPDEFLCRSRYSIDVHQKIRLHGRIGLESEGIDR